MVAKIEWVGDDKSVLQAMDRMQKQTDKLIAQNRRMREQSKKTGKVANSNFNAMAAGAAAATAAMALTYRAVGQVNKALEDQHRLQDAAKGAQKTLAQTQADVIFMMGDATTKQKKSFLSDLIEVNDASKFANLGMMQAAASKVLSGSQGRTDIALPMLRTAAPLFQHRPEGLGDFAGTGAQLVRTAGLTPRQATALLVTLGGQARTEQLTDVGQFGGMASASSTSFPQNKLESSLQTASLWAAVTGTAGDKTGKPSRTGILKMTEKLREFAPTAADPFSALRTLQGASEAQRTKFMSSGFEAEVKHAFRQLVMQPQGGQTGADARAIYRKMEGAEGRLDLMIEQMTTLTPQIRGASKGKQLADLHRGFMSGETELQDAADARKAIRDSLDLQRGVTGFIARQIIPSITDFQMLIGHDPTELATEYLRGQRRELTDGVVGGLIGSGRGGPSDDRTAQHLGKVLDTLQGMDSKMQPIQTNAEGND